MFEIGNPLILMVEDKRRPHAKGTIGRFLLILCFLCYLVIKSKYSFREFLCVYGKFKIAKTLKIHTDNMQKYTKYVDYNVYYDI